jgi:hypothetical protein
MSEFKRLETTVTYQNQIQEHIWSRLNKGNACYHEAAKFCLSVSYLQLYLKLNYAPSHKVYGSVWLASRPGRI